MPPRAELASGSAVLATARQLGSALGVATFVTVVGGGTASGLAGFDRARVGVVITAAVTAFAGLATGRRPAGRCPPTWCRNCRAELPREVPRPAADIGHHPPAQIQVLGELAGGVAGQVGVLRVRGRLLGAERPQQPDRPGRIRPEGGTIVHEDL
jgi:hypothetical protein